MKKALVLTFVLLTSLAVVGTAGPFLGFDFIIPDDGTLYFGVEDGPLTLTLSVCDLFLVPPTLTFEAEHCTEFAYWDNELDFWIDEIDFVSTYPIPKAKGMGFSWCGTLHVGDLLSERPAELSQTSSNTFDIYGKVSFEYKRGPQQLVPTGSFGFYWEPW